MRIAIRALCLAIIFLVFGCSSDPAKRIVYESLQNKAQMDCQENPGSTCPEKESYDDYQRGLKK
jgi:hypothetical protein